jgi:hypothetical protein
LKIATEELTNELKTYKRAMGNLKDLDAIDVFEHCGSSIRLFLFIMDRMIHLFSFS